MLNTKKENNYLILIWILSVAIPVVVAILLFMPSKVDVKSGWVSVLPHLNALLNSTTAIALVIGFIFIKKKQVAYHKLCMLIAFSLGTLFLISYVIYHASAPSTVFGDINGNGILEEVELLQLGSMRTIYLVILLSHILLAIVVVPFVLIALFHALSNRFDRHKKIVKYTLPIWLFVSISGVVVYLLISPYYQ